MTVGDAVGKLQITRLYEVTGGNGRPRRMADAVCECGNPVTAPLSRLRHGGRSCGCGYVRHGLTKLPGGLKCLAAARHAYARCTDPDHPKYKSWGAKGVGFKYPSIEAGARDFCAKGLGVPGTYLDRIDPEGHYEPSNVRAVTQAESIANTRAAKLKREREAAETPAEPPVTRLIPTPADDDAPLPSARRRRRGHRRSLTLPDREPTPDSSSDEREAA